MPLKQEGKKTEVAILFLGNEIFSIIKQPADQLIIYVDAFYSFYFYFVVESRVQSVLILTSHSSNIYVKY